MRMAGHPSLPAGIVNPGMPNCAAKFVDRFSPRFSFRWSKTPTRASLIRLPAKMCVSLTASESLRRTVSRPNPG
jgi:hypothetical protein